MASTEPSTSPGKVGGRGGVTKVGQWAGPSMHRPTPLFNRGIEFLICVCVCAPLMMTCSLRSSLAALSLCLVANLFLLARYRADFLCFQLRWQSPSLSFRYSSRCACCFSSMALCSSRSLCCSSS